MRRRRTTTTRHFLHIPKTGGTALIEALSPVAAAHRIELHQHATVLDDIPADEDVFFCLRHPVSRFVSGFNSRMRSGAPRYHFPWTESETAAFTRFGTVNELAEALHSPDTDTAEAARNAMAGIRLVNVPLSNWLHSVDALKARRRRVVLIGLQRFLVSDFEHLKRRLQLPVSLTLPDDPVLSHRAPGTQDSQLSPLGAANLAAWFADDIAFYRDCQRLRAKWHRLPTDPT
jgi:hypothetical protein